MSDGIHLSSKCETCGCDPSRPDGIGEATCKHCGASVSFVQSAVNPAKSIPVNPRTVTIIDRDGRQVRGRVAHFATCPRTRRNR